MNLISRPFVFVRWLDAATSHGWTEGLDEGAEPDIDVEEVWSSGHLVSRDRRQIKLASDVGMEGGSCNRLIAIPFGMVREIRQDSMSGTLLYLRNSRAKAKAQKESTNS